MNTLADVYAQARFLLGDPQADVWNNAVLFQYVCTAYRESLRILRGAELQAFRKQMASTVVLAAGDTVIDYTTPVATPLPSDFLRPLELEEKATGSTTTKFTAMRKEKGLFADRAPDALRALWQWREKAIRLPAGSGSVDIRIQYEADLFDITAAYTFTVNGASFATPIVIGTTAVHTPLAVGDVVYISGVGGNLAANGWWEVQTLPTTTSLTLLGSAGSAAYTSGGTMAVYQSSHPLAIPDLQDAVAFFASAYAARSRDQTELFGVYSGKAQEILGQIIAAEKAVEKTTQAKFGVK